MNNISDQQKENAKKLGIAISHYDLDGQLIHANPETLDYFTELLQLPDNIKPTTKIKDRFDDVIIVNENSPIKYDTAQLISENKEIVKEHSVKYQLTDEEGKNKLTGESTSLQPILLPPLSYGYYVLCIYLAKKTYQIRLLVQPKTTYQPPVLTEKKAWGLNIQLYSLRSERNWGIGDFGDLRYLIENLVKFNIDFIGINPLHLLYPAVPEWASPYSSSSRSWLNYLYVDVENLPEFKLCKTVQQWVHQQTPKLTQLREMELVDYHAVNQLKITALEQLFSFFKRSKSVKISKRREQFQEFVTAQGDALLYQGLFNLFDTQEHDKIPDDENKIGWLGWRQEWQHLTAKKRNELLRKAKNDNKVMFYAWLQWITEQQLSELSQLCQTLGMQLGIYGDLAVSSSKGSVDVWCDPEIYCVEASIGAPPDSLGPIGQNWNLPPYNPSMLKKRGFQPFIDMLRINMKHFGILRIDHVMGLFRLWLIPQQKTAVDGVYVYYPFDALMAILAIESQRNKCLIIGEDLGIVPNEVRSKLSEFQVFSYFVLYFEQRNHEYPKAENYPLNAFATIGTHDLPSLSSFWHCHDLKLFEELNILNGELLKQKYDQRVLDKQALLNTLHRDQYLPEDYQGDALSMAMHDNLNQVIHRYLAESQSKLIGIQLENLLSQDISFNLPGTSSEYPNWRKKLARPLEHIFNDDYIISFLTFINQTRNS